jgi:hypothetical protein
VRSKLPAEVTDVKVDTPVEGRKFSIEHLLDELFASERLAR